MSYKMMWRTIQMKMRYGIRSYLFFLIATLIFIGIYILELFIMEPDDIQNSQSIYMIAFLYIPVLVSQAIQTVEYSKCYYLIPKTKEDRKRFIIFQNIVKIATSFLMTTLLLVIGIIIRPEAIRYLVNWYMLVGISFSLCMGCNGYSTYNGKKQTTYRSYIVTYIITVIVMCAVMIGGMFLINQKSVRLWLGVSSVTIVASAIYCLYYYIRFRHIEAVYENINKEERRFVSRMNNSMM